MRPENRLLLHIWIFVAGLAVGNLFVLWWFR